MTDEKNLLGIVGMCRAAGKAVIGTPMICEYLRGRAKKRDCGKGEVDVIVLEASDTSENTHKKISDIPRKIPRSSPFRSSIPCNA